MKKAAQELDPRADLQKLRDSVEQPTPPAEPTPPHEHEQH